MAHLEPLLTLWEGLEPYKTLVTSLKKGRSGQVFGLSGSLPSFITAALAQDVDRPALIVTVGFQEARKMETELLYFLPDTSVFLLPPRPHVVGDIKAESQAWQERRLAALAHAQSDPKTILIAPAEAARQLVAPSTVASYKLRPGLRVEPEEVAGHLIRLGYRREPEVTEEGQFSWRGGIMDVFRPGGPAWRIEWFDIEVDSVRVFDPKTQRTVEMLSEIVIGPARELLWTQEARNRAMSRLADESGRLIQHLESMGQFDKAQKAKERFGRYLNDLSEDRSFPGIDRFSAAFYAPLKPLTQIFGQLPLVVYDDFPRIVEALKGRDLEESNERQRRLEQGNFLPVEQELTVTHDVFSHVLKGHADVSLSLMPHTRRLSGEVLSLTARPAPRIHGQGDLLKTEVNRLRKGRLRVALVVRDQDAERVVTQQLLEDGIPVHNGLGMRGEVGILTGQLGHGFVVAELGLAVLGETELSGREIRPRHPRRREPQRGVRIQDLRPGDYVVHITHGIGQFLGVTTLEIQGQHKDYLHVQYAGEDTLYVPVDQLVLVQKYIGVEGQAPKLSRMGGGEWNRTKDKVKASVREMAQELIKLYALRESRSGYAFPPDTPWQQEVEAAFPYEETEDQLRAIQEIKRDMECGRPMDRLLCGDVGYGKTEVALRAAFKAIMAGKQVAFLVPTTVLAEQHFLTAKTRLAGYPVNIEVLSRFRTTKQQKTIIEKLSQGQIDLVVGTHRILGTDVKFHDLGLLIVDEEHRFGVGHKERIKALKENVDVLTLTATPIPRTLHMALVGIRDMSLIETPPEDRLPVETVVAEYDEDLVREAIRREIDRGGQVFYVQNRIMAMDAVVTRLIKMFPEVRVAVVHGQMEENRIEDIMARFIDQEYDVLVATSIIESGLDIPNANTIVVEDADRLGLAQLYQLRGRVGRSARLAYAYFTYRRDKMLTPAAEKRLEAIREFTELGAGYQIALRDLEIRGAGNLLGAEQHGFIASVGFDLYTELLGQAIRELRGQQTENIPDPSIEMNVDAYIPDTYVSDAGQKIALYKRIVSAGNLSQIAEMVDEIEDRFGPKPESVDTLLLLARVRVLARQLRFVSVSYARDRIMFRGLPDSPVGPEAIRAMASRYPGRLVQGASKAPEMGVRVHSKATPREVLEVAEDILLTIKGALQHAEQKSG